MELKTIRLSDEMRDRLETAMKHVNDSDGSKDSDYVLAAFSAAILENPRTIKETFGLTPLNQAQRAEATLLMDAVISMANGSGNPAVVIENLPHNNEEIYKLALTGLSLAINTGRRTPEDRNPSAKETERQHYSGRASFIGSVSYPSKSTVEAMAKDDLHSDNAGFKGPEVRILAGKIVGNRPLSTAIVPVDEWINEITAQIAKRPASANLSTEWDKVRIRNEVIKTLEAPIWGNESDNSRDGYASNKNRSIIFKNLHSGNGVPEYGLMMNPKTQMSPRDYNKDELHKLELSEEFAERVRIIGHEALQQMKKTAADVVLEPGMALLWNDQMVLHGTGRFKNKEIADKRELHDMNVPLLAAENNEYPGAQPLMSALQLNAPESISVRSQVKRD